MTSRQARLATSTAARCTDLIPVCSGRHQVGMAQQGKEHLPETQLPQSVRQARPLVNNHGKKGSDTAVAHFGAHVLTDALRMESCCGQQGCT